MSGWWAASYAALWVLVVVLCIVVVALARQIGTLHLRLGPRGALELDDEGPTLGEAPQPVDARDVDGRPVTIGGPGGAQLLLFVSPGCNVCADVLPAVRAVADAGDLAPYVITDTEPEATLRVLDRSAARAPVVASIELAGDYRIPGTPYVVVLDSMGIVRAKGTANNLEQLEGLVDTARRRLREAG